MDAKKMTEIVLASNSPRRKELMRQVGMTFTSSPAHIDESILPGEKPEEYVVRVATNKAQVASKRVGKGVVVAADTVVVLEDTILGKPVDEQDAIRMLSMLSGKMHRVVTAISVMDAGTGKTLTRTSVTKVWFKKLTENEIRYYVSTGEPLDKAGAYGIQEKGALLVDRIEGCYFNVVGLPMSLLDEMLKTFGIKMMS